MSNLPSNLRFNLENESGETFVTCELNNTNAREYIYLQATERFTIESVRESLAKYMELLKLTQCPHLIIDTRHFEGEWMQLQDCFDHELNDARDEGLKYFAHIIPKDLARTAAICGTKDNFEANGVAYESFTGAASAVGWVEMCEAV
jgi:hypothetical protein